MRIGGGGLLALVFAIGGGSGWLVSRITPQPPRVPTARLQTLPATLTSPPLLQKNSPVGSPQAVQPAPAPPKTTAQSLEESVEMGRSAGKVLAGLERAYQSQEQRILRLEAALEKSRTQSTSEELNQVTDVEEQSPTDRDMQPNHDEVRPSSEGRLAFAMEDTEPSGSEPSPRRENVTMNVQNTEIYDETTIHGDLIEGDHATHQVLVTNNLATVVVARATSAAETVNSPGKRATLRSQMLNNWYRWEPSIDDRRASAPGPSTTGSPGLTPTRFVNQSSVNTIARRRLGAQQAARAQIAEPRSKGLAPRHDPWARIDFSRYNNPYDSTFGK